MVWSLANMEYSNRWVRTATMRWDEGRPECRGNDGSLNLLTILAAQAHGY
jgi:hypothetical protein